MLRKALLVGINAYEDAPLSGCVNDVLDFRSMLLARGWKPREIRLLLDKRATAAAIEDRLQWLTARSIPGQLIFGFSGHGSQVRCRDTDDDELRDHKDEILCPYDYQDLWDDPLSDDVLASYFKRLKVNATRLTVVLDCCHAGTGTREVSPSPNPQRAVPRYVRPPLDVLMRSDDPGCVAVNRVGVKQTLTFDLDPKMNHVLLAACQSNQTSADSEFDGRPNGAFTRNLLDALKTLGAGHTWVDYMLQTSKQLKAQGFNQTPAIEGPGEHVNGYPDF